MLEASSLLLKPWIHTLEADWPKTVTQGAGWMRAIVQPTTQQTLGCAAWDDLAISKLFYYLGRRRIHVFESEDESLLMTLCKPWGLSTMWEVLDAEERLVGRLCRDTVYDGYGAILARMTQDGDGSAWQWRGADGVVLATWRDLPGQGCYFRFEAAFDPNPFVRMATLAGVLALPPWPGDVSLIARPAV